VRFRLVTVAVVSVMSLACTSESTRSTTAFCAALGDNIELLEGPLSTPGDLAALLTRYRELARVAPLSVEDSWTVITDLVEAAAAVDRQDADAVARLAEQAFAADLAAREVAAWAAERCGVTVPRAPRG
jgi:hypothetical protein